MSIDEFLFDNKINLLETSTWRHRTFRLDVINAGRSLLGGARLRRDGGGDCFRLRVRYVQMVHDPSVLLQQSRAGTDVGVRAEAAPVVMYRYVGILVSDGDVTSDLK